MRCLDIAGMVVAEGSSHSLWVYVLGDHVVVIREFVVTDRTDPLLLTIFCLSGFRISAGDRSSRYPLG